MDHNLPLLEKPLQFSVAGTEMVDPNRSIRENQCGRTRGAEYSSNSAWCRREKPIFERFPARSAL
jgi:hypothetical protein